MTNKLTKQDIINWATSRDWELDKYGHLQKWIEEKQYRFKLSNTSLRYEVKVKAFRAPSEWMRLSSGYYKDLSITPEGKLSGLRM